MKPADISFRIPTTIWMNPNSLERLLSEIATRTRMTDELSLFTSFTHPPLPIPEIERRMAVAAEAMVRIRDRGLGAGINVLASIGHHEEDLAHALGAEYPRATDIAGRICRGSLCPTSTDTIDYIKRLYEAVLVAAPDFIWIDDDVRLLGHMPIRAVCFCDHCLSHFADDAVAYSRDELRNAFNTGDIEAKDRVRRQWLEHNRRAIDRILATIEETVHARAPEMPLGFMTGERFYEGYDFAEWAHTLSGPRAAPVRWRPGGGFYTDRSPELMLEKVHEIGRQSAAVGTRAENVQSELENFPYQRLSKSERIVITEAASDIAAGCTGVAFNVMGSFEADLEESLPLFDAIGRSRPFFDRVADAFGGAVRTGIEASWNRDAMAASNLSSGDWLEGSFGDFSAAFPSELFEIGLPTAYDPAGRIAAVLKGETAAILSDETLETLLSTSLYLDAAALSHLHRRGFSKLVGFEPGDSFTADCIEEFSSHELNGEFPGYQRDVRQSFWPQPAVSLAPVREGTQTISRLVDYSGEEIAPVCFGVFENDLGGRVAVSGYAPWSLIHSRAKACQLKRVFRWLTNDRLEAFIASFHRMSLWISVKRNGSGTLFAVNASIDRSRGAMLALRRPGDTVRCVDRHGTETSLASVGVDGAYRLFALPEIDSWDAVLLLF